MRCARCERTGPSKAASLIAAAMTLLLGTLSPVGCYGRAEGSFRIRDGWGDRGRHPRRGDRVRPGFGRLRPGANPQRCLRADGRTSGSLGGGFAEGLAFACCGRESKVAVHSSIGSTGQIVHSESRAGTFRGAIADRDNRSAILPMAMRRRSSSPGRPAIGLIPRDQAVREPWDHLGGSIVGLIDVGQGTARRYRERLRVRADVRGRHPMAPVPGFPGRNAEQARHRRWRALRPSPVPRARRLLPSAYSHSSLVHVVNGPHRTISREVQVE